MFSEEKTQLSKEGREMKKMLVSGERKRAAHTPSYDPALIKKPALSRWTGTQRLNNLGDVWALHALLNINIPQVAIVGISIHIYQYAYPFF